MIGRDNVKHVYKGHGQMAQDGYESPQWIEGRLVEYNNGCLSFVWFHGGGALVHQLQAGGGCAVGYGGGEAGWTMRVG